MEIVRRVEVLSREYNRVGEELGSDVSDWSFEGWWFLVWILRNFGVGWMFKKRLQSQELQPFLWCWINGMSLSIRRFGMWRGEEYSCIPYLWTHRNSRFCRCVPTMARCIRMVRESLCGVPIFRVLGIRWWRWVPVYCCGRTSLLPWGIPARILWHHSGKCREWLSICLLGKGCCPELHNLLIQSEWGCICLFR